MTTLNFQLAHAVARTLEPGDEIVVTDLDHDANVSPWLLVAADHDLVVRHAPIRPTTPRSTSTRSRRCSASARAWSRSRWPRTPTGSITDAARIAAAARRVGALAWADGVHLAPHRRLDRAGLGLDVLLCSPYKFFGPHLGVAAIRRELAESLPADRVRPADEWPPGHRFEAGTQSHEAIAGTTAAIDYLRELGDGDLDRAYERIEAHEQRLSRSFLEGLPGRVCGLYGIADPDAARRAHADVLPRRRGPSSRARRPACSHARTSTSGTATTTRSSRCGRSGSGARERCASASCTTRRWTRSSAR